MNTSKIILCYRWIVFVTATFFVLYTVVFADWSAVGGPLRYLTIWALFLSCAASFLVLRMSRGRSTRSWDVLVSTTAVINAMVVFLYWRLFFSDPTSVTSDGTLDVWWREYYLHAAGPLLMWIDALFINRVFQRIKLGVLLLVSVFILYICWAELVVGRFNDTPAGSVTSGLPYPFLNDLSLAGRATFYGVNIAVAVIFFFGFALVAWALRRRLAR